jgi:DNA mismatch repair protein MutS2
MKHYPNDALEQLEFTKIQQLLMALCTTVYAQQKVEQLRIHNDFKYVQIALLQTHQLKQLLQSGTTYPTVYTNNVSRELKLLALPSSCLMPEQWMAVKKLLLSVLNITKWLNDEKQLLYPELCLLIKDVRYNSYILQLIEAVFDETGLIKDNASADLTHIRQMLTRKRQEQRIKFARLLVKYRKAGYVTDTEESYLNGRKVIAVFSEYKRQVKGILHGESETRRTSYLEPEETIDINNEVFEYELAEQKEINKILVALTNQVRPLQPELLQYYTLCGELDFINVKSKLAIELDAHLPLLHNKSTMELFKARHPLLYLHNKKVSKPTIPLNISLHTQQRIIIISGPNAGGKTIAMKTIGLLQLMLQAGLLVPVEPHSTMGVFKQLFVQIGDAQSIEHELSTYSSHLMHMKHFTDMANGRTLFLIDELGGGTDPNLGGAIAEAILEVLMHKHALGIVP